ATSVQAFARPTLRRFTASGAPGTGESAAASRATASKQTTKGQMTALARIDTGDKSPKCQAVRGRDPAPAAADTPKDSAVRRLAPNHNDPQGPYNCLGRYGSVPVIQENHGFTRSAIRPIAATTPNESLAPGWKTTWPSART